VGVGGPWADTRTKPDQPSDPYLINGYNRKSLTLKSSEPCQITAEIDITGMGDWHPYKTFDLKAGEATKHEFPGAFQAYWIRFRTDKETSASAELVYQ
jgi:hypothetical protein